MVLSSELTQSRQERRCSEAKMFISLNNVISAVNKIVSLSLSLSQKLA
jgi:hypothetical protein